MAKNRSKQNPLLLVGIGVGLGYLLFNKKAADTAPKTVLLDLPTDTAAQGYRIRSTDTGPRRRSIKTIVI